MAARARNIQKESPGKLLLCYSLLVALVAGFAYADRRDRENLEAFGFPTGLGDTELFVIPEEYDLFKPILELDGEPVYQRWRDPRDRPDDRMLKIVRNDGDRLYLYQDGLLRLKGEAEGTDESGIFYVKTGENLYLEVGPPKLGLPGDEGNDAGNGDTSSPAASGSN